MKLRNLPNNTLHTTWICAVIPIIAEMLRDASQRQGIIDETNQCIKVVKYNSVVCVAICVKLSRNNTVTE